MKVISEAVIMTVHITKNFAVTDAEKVPLRKGGTDHTMTPEYVTITWTGNKTKSGYYIAVGGTYTDTDGSTDSGRRTYWDTYPTLIPAWLREMEKDNRPDFSKIVTV